MSQHFIDQLVLRQARNLKRESNRVETVKRHLREQREDKESLENLVAFALTQKDIGPTRVAKSLGLTRETVRTMAARANDRNNKMLKAGNTFEDQV